MLDSLTTDGPVVHPTGLSEPNEVPLQETAQVVHPTGLSEPDYGPGEKPS